MNFHSVGRLVMFLRDRDQIRDHIVSEIKRLISNRNVEINLKSVDALRKGFNIKNGNSMGSFDDGERLKALELFEELLKSFLTEQPHFSSEIRESWESSRTLDRVRYRCFMLTDDSVKLDGELTTRDKASISTWGLFTVERTWSRLIELLEDHMDSDLDSLLFLDKTVILTPKRHEFRYVSNKEVVPVNIGKTDCDSLSVLETHIVNYPLLSNVGSSDNMRYRWRIRAADVLLERCFDLFRRTIDPDQRGVPKTTEWMDSLCGSFSDGVGALDVLNNDPTRHTGAIKDFFDRILFLVTNPANGIDPSRSVRAVILSLAKCNGTLQEKTKMTTSRISHGIPRYYSVFDHHGGDKLHLLSDCSHAVKGCHPLSNANDTPLLPEKYDFKSESSLFVRFDEFGSGVLDDFSELGALMDNMGSGHKELLLKSFGMILRSYSQDSASTFLDIVCERLFMSFKEGRHKWGDKSERDAFRLNLLAKQLAHMSNAKSYAITTVPGNVKPNTHEGVLGTSITRLSGNDQETLLMVADHHPAPVSGPIVDWNNDNIEWNGFQPIDLFSTWEAQKFDSFTELNLSQRRLFRSQLFTAIETIACMCALVLVDKQGVSSLNGYQEAWRAGLGMQGLPVVNGNGSVGFSKGFRLSSKITNGDNAEFDSIFDDGAIVRLTKVDGEFPLGKSLPRERDMNVSGFLRPARSHKKSEIGRSEVVLANKQNTRYGNFTFIHLNRGTGRAIPTSISSASLIGQLQSKPEVSELIPGRLVHCAVSVGSHENDYTWFKVDKRLPVYPDQGSEICSDNRWRNIALLTRKGCVVSSFCFESKLGGEKTSPLLSIHNHSLDAPVALERLAGKSYYWNHKKFRDKSYKGVLGKIRVGFACQGTMRTSSILLDEREITPVVLCYNNTYDEINHTTTRTPSVIAGGRFGKILPLAQFLDDLQREEFQVVDPWTGASLINSVLGSVPNFVNSQRMSVTQVVNGGIPIKENLGLVEFIAYTYDNKSNLRGVHTDFSAFLLHDKCVKSDVRKDFFLQRQPGYDICHNLDGSLSFGSGVAIEKYFAQHSGTQLSRQLIGAESEIGIRKKLV